MNKYKLHECCWFTTVCKIILLFYFQNRCFYWCQKKEILLIIIMLILITSIIWTFRTDKEIYFINWEAFNRKKIKQKYIIENAANLTKICAIRIMTLPFALLTTRIQICFSDRVDTNDLSWNCLNRPELNFVGYRTFPAETT